MDIHNIQNSAISTGYLRNPSKRIETTWHLLEELPKQYAVPREPLQPQQKEQLPEQLDLKSLRAIPASIAYKRDGMHVTFSAGIIIDRKG